MKFERDLTLAKERFGKAARCDFSSSATWAKVAIEAVGREAEAVLIAAAARTDLAAAHMDVVLMAAIMAAIMVRQVVATVAIVMTTALGSEVPSVHPVHRVSLLGTCCFFL